MMWTHPVWSCNSSWTDQNCFKTLQNYKVYCTSVWGVNLKCFCTVFTEFLQSYTQSLFGFVTAWQSETNDTIISCKRVHLVVWSASWVVPQFHKFQHQPWKERRPTLVFLFISNKLSCCCCSQLLEMPGYLWQVAALSFNSEVWPFP